MKNKKFLIPTMILGSMIIGVSFGKAFKVGAEGTVDPHNPDQEAIIDPIVSYQFDDESNVGKDSMGNFNLTKVGAGTISVEGGVANQNHLLFQLQKRNVF